MDYIFLFKYYSQKAIKNASKVFLVMAVLLGATALFLSFLPKNTSTKTIARKDNPKLQYIYNSMAELEAKDPGSLFSVFIRSSSCSIIGELCTANISDKENNIKNSLIGMGTTLIFKPLENPPASGTYYVYNKLHDAGFVPKSYAAPLQGIGFASLRPFQNIWVLFRNLVYFLFVIMITIIGFMIMFRAKLGAQTAISVESALPKITIALILVTFSFAIAGFMIDLMYVSIGMIVLVFNSATDGTGAKLLKDANLGALISEFFFSPQIFFPSDNIWKIANAFVAIIPSGAKEALDIILSELSLSLIASLIAAKGLGATNKFKFAFGGASFLAKGIVNGLDFTKDSAALGGTMSGIAAFIQILLYLFVAWLFSYVGLAIIIWILIMLSVTFVLFRILFLAFHAYLQVILLVILSPLVIALEAIPGKSTFSSWLGNLAVNLSTFPVITLIILLSRAIMNLPVEGGTAALWEPPLIYQFDAQAFQTLIGGALIFMIPDIVEMFKQMTGIKPMSASLNMMSFFAGGAAVGSAGMGILSKASMFSMGIDGIGKLKGKLFNPAGGDDGKSKGPAPQVQR